MMSVGKNRKLKRISVILLSFFAFQIPVFPQTADLVVINADIRAIDEKKPRAEALAVTKNRISAVGTNREIRALIGENTKVIDAGGKLLLPGFNDAHVHFTGMGSQFFFADLRGARSPAEIAEKIGSHARFLPKGHWILGSGWNNENWTPDDLPTKELIDRAAPENPVFLYHSNTKIALVNSLALKLARINKSAKDAPDKGIVRDAGGEPTGILSDSALNRVRLLAPQFATENKIAAAETASNYAAAFGVTSVQDLSADDNTKNYRELARQGKLKTRIYDCAALSDWQSLAKNNIKKADGDAFVRRGCLKGTADGDRNSTARLYEQISAADRAGLQITVHAIGARANAQILSIFERVTKENGARDRRFRIEHAHAFSAPQDIRRFGKSGIIASVQPFLFSNGAGKSLEPLRGLINNKAALAFGSDSSLISVNPLFGIAAAVETSDSRQKLTVEEAVRFYTVGSAYAEFQENEKGSIAVGKLADLVILSDDIFKVNPENIRRTRVLTTVVDGKIVYQTN